MEERTLSAIEAQRFNKWRHQKGLSVPGGTGADFICQMGGGQRVTQPALLFKALGKKGLEFLAVSNVQLESPVQLADEIVLVPCFGAAAVAAAEESEKQAVFMLEFSMKAKGRFIYDGWLPVPDWSPETVERRIARLDEVLSCFSLHSSCHVRWMYKYPQGTSPGGHAKFTLTEIEASKTVRGAVDCIGNKQDRATLNRALKWLAKAASAHEPEMRLLFSVVGLETLVKRKLQPDSQLLPKTAKRALAVDEGNLAEQLALVVSQCAGDPAELLRQAGELLRTDKMQWTVQSEIGKVLTDESWVADSKAGLARVYNIRHDLAHGSYDSGNLDLQEEVAKLAPRTVELLRKYIGIVVTQTTETQAQWEPRTMSFPMVLVAEDPGWVATGPTHMAILYG